MTVAEAHLQIRICPILAEHGINGSLYIITQTGQAGVVRCRRSENGNKIVYQTHPITLVKGNIQGGIAGNMAVGKLAETGGQQFLVPGGSQDGEVAGSAQVDLAVLLPGGKMGGTAEHDPLPCPGIYRQSGSGINRCIYGKYRIFSAAQVNQFTGVEIAPQTYLTPGLDGDGGCAAESFNRTAQTFAEAVAGIRNIAPRHQHAVDFGILYRGYIDTAIGIADYHFGGTGHSDATVISAAAAGQSDFFTGPDNGADFNHRAVNGTGHSAQPELSVSRNIYPGFQRIPGEGLRLQVPQFVKCLGDTAAGKDHPHGADIANGVYFDQAAAGTGGETGCSEAGSCRQQQGDTVVIGTR